MVNRLLHLVRKLNVLSPESGRHLCTFVGMNELWSPWRSQFIESAKEPATGDSPFTIAFRTPESDAENHLLHRGEHAFIILNKYPYNAGHLLVVPIRQVGVFLELSQQESQEMMRLIRLGVDILQRALHPHGFNIGMNLGRIAGAGIENHVHFHVVPRWNGDTNFMPVLSETRVISESMDRVYNKLLLAREHIVSSDT